MYFTLSEQLVFIQLINEIDTTRKQFDLLHSNVKDLLNKVDELQYKNKLLRDTLVTCEINMKNLPKYNIDPWYRDNFLATIKAALDAAGG